MCEGVKKKPIMANSQVTYEDANTWNELGPESNIGA